MKKDAISDLQKIQAKLADQVTALEQEQAVRGFDDILVTDELQDVYAGYAKWDDTHRQAANDTVRQIAQHMATLFRAEIDAWRKMINIEASSSVSESAFLLWLKTVVMLDTKGLIRLEKFLQGAITAESILQLSQATAIRPAISSELFTEEALATLGLAKSNKSNGREELIDLLLDGSRLGNQLVATLAAERPDLSSTSAAALALTSDDPAQVQGMRATFFLVGIMNVILKLNNHYLTAQAEIAAREGD